MAFDKNWAPATIGGACRAIPLDWIAATWNNLATRRSLGYISHAFGGFPSEKSDNGYGHVRWTSMMLMMAHTDRRNVVNRLPDYICYGFLLALWTVTTDAQNAKIQVPLGTYTLPCCMSAAPRGFIRQCDNYNLKSHRECNDIVSYEFISIRRGISLYLVKCSLLCAVYSTDWLQPAPLHEVWPYGA